MNIRKKKEKEEIAEQNRKAVDPEQKVVDENKANAAGSPNETGESSEKEVNTKEQELQKKLDEINDKYLRLYSEFDNYRRRTIKERIELARTASSEIILDLLPVLDDFERAAKSSAESENCGVIKEGMNLIYNKFKVILERKGLKPIEAIGQEFNTDYHEAITYTPAPAEDLKNRIVDELEKGYLLNDKVLRYTKVVIGQ
jgi:molecular chaperone GrpE